MRYLHLWPIFPIHLETPVARSLSIQFLLQALLEAFDLMKTMQQTTPFQLKGIHFKQETQDLCKQLEKIYLFSVENPFSQKGSLLDKICFYSEILTQFSPINDLPLISIMEEIRKLIISMKAKIRVWKKIQTRYPLEEVTGQFMDLYNHILEKLSSFFHHLTPFLKDARSDENVLVYLIENKEKLNRYIGDRQIETLLQAFFPKGPEQMRTAIHEGYTRRGFTTFLNSIEPLIDEVQWETPCYCQEML
jgi:hypothetical protein